MTFVPKTMPSKAYLREIFEQCDENNSGSISMHELQKALSYVKWYYFNTKIVKMFMYIFDKDDNGSISFEEFGSLWSYLLAWRICFQHFDRNGDDRLDIKELRNALKKLGYSVELQTVMLYLEQYDRSCTGFLNFDDFIEVCVEVSKQHYGPNVHELMGETLVF